MRRQLVLLVSIVLTCSRTIAQPIINATDYPVGNETPYTLMSGSGSISPGPGGENIIWDFSSLQSTNTLNYISHNCDTYCDTFMGSNFNFAQNQQNYGNYCIKNNSGLFYNGYRSENNNQTIVSKYGNAEQWMMFPMKFNATFSDTTYDTTYRYISGNMVPPDFDYGNSSGIIDGYGTLKTPMGTYLNTLRLKRYRMWVRNNTDTTILETYLWFQAGTGHAIVEIDYGDQNSIQGFRYTTSAPNNVDDVEELVNEKYKVALYPNPTQNAFNVNVEGIKDFKIVVRNIVGNTIYNTAQVGKNSTTTILTSGWAKGIYIVEVQGQAENKIINQKLVVN